MNKCHFYSSFESSFTSCMAAFFIRIYLLNHTNSDSHKTTVQRPPPSVIISICFSAFESNSGDFRSSVDRFSSHSSWQFDIILFASPNREVHCIYTKKTHKIEYELLSHQSTAMNQQEHSNE
eukprot:25706_1